MSRTIDKAKLVFLLEQYTIMTMEAVTHLDKVLNEPEPHSEDYIDRLLVAKATAEALDGRRQELKEMLAEYEKSATFAEQP